MTDIDKYMVPGHREKRATYCLERMTEDDVRVLNDAGKEYDGLYEKVKAQIDNDRHRKYIKRILRLDYQFKAVEAYQRMRRQNNGNGD